MKLRVALGGRYGNVVKRRLTDARQHGVGVKTNVRLILGARSAMCSPAQRKIMVPRSLTHCVSVLNEAG